MVYSLSRFRHFKPTPPFELGGEYTRFGNRHFLKNASDVIQFSGPDENVGSLNPGDLVVLQVKAADEVCLLVDKVDLMVRAVAGGTMGAKPHATRFTDFLAEVRKFFVAGGFNEILTPTLVGCPGLEPSLEAFSTEIVYGSARHTAYLPTSPEIHLKKALAEGWTDIFEIKNCFRKGEFSAHHEAEFLMLEWYRGFADLDMIETDLRNLLGTLDQAGWIEGGPVQIQTTDFATLFRDAIGFELTPRTSGHELRRLCHDVHVDMAANDTFDDLFHRLLIERIEPQMERMGPTIVRRFPPSQAALAKLDEEGWADRFEFYWRGIELANAFNEVVDPAEQERRWNLEMKERARLGTSTLPTDPGLINALKKGIPPTGGIAMGLERLYMACTGVNEIKELRLFSARNLFVD
jgi:lysyl-tRNA synthetase class 2